MKKISSILSILTVVCVTITLIAVPTFATNSEQIIDSLPDFSNNYVPSSLVGYSIDDKVINNEPSQYNIVEIIVSKEDIEIESAMYSEFIDVFGKLENGKYVNINDKVVCQFADDSIATWIYGRIIAEKSGITTAVLSYSGQSKEIIITVNNQINSELDMALPNDNINVNVVIVPNISQRLSILNIAEQMVDMVWTPTQNLNAYGSHPSFIAGTTYTGMPYTQCHDQSTYDEFFAAFNNSSSSGFYDNYTEGGVTMPKYGNDCSGFVSICWGLFRDDTWRDRWNTTDFRNAIEAGTYDEVSYSNLLPGDALCKRGHIMLVKSVSTTNSTVTVYEQTDRSARESIYTFDDLAAGSYVGFTKF